MAITRARLGVGDDALKNRLGGWGGEREGGAAFGSRGFSASIFKAPLEKRLKPAVTGAVYTDPVYSDDLGDVVVGGGDREVN